MRFVTILVYQEILSTKFRKLRNNPALNIILSDVNSMHFVTFLLLLMKCLQLKINLC